MNIEFNQEEFTSFEPKDMMDLVKYITSEWTLQQKRRILINRFKTYNSLAAGEENMTTVVVEFQAWKEGEYGFGTFYEWRAHRAKDFSCGNYSFKTITGQYQNYTKTLR